MAKITIDDDCGDMRYEVETYEGLVHLKSSPEDGSESLSAAQARALAAALEHFATAVESNR